MSPILGVGGRGGVFFVWFRFGLALSSRVGRSCVIHKRTHRVPSVPQLASENKGKSSISPANNQHTHTHTHTEQVDEGTYIHKD